MIYKLYVLYIYRCTIAEQKLESTKDEIDTNQSKEHQKNKIKRFKLFLLRAAVFCFFVLFGLWYSLKHKRCLRDGPSKKNHCILRSI